VTLLEINKQADAYGPFQRIWPEMWADMFRIEWEVFSALTTGGFTDEKRAKLQEVVDSTAFRTTKMI
jgi:hypothetical protein